MNGENVRNLLREIKRDLEILCEDNEVMKRVIRAYMNKRIAEAESL